MGTAIRHPAARALATSLVGMCGAWMVAVVAGCVHMHAEPRVPRPPSVRKAFERFEAEGGASSVVALDDNADAWAARWRLMEGAQRSIDASYFIIENDVFGLAFLGNLYAHAVKGVDVRLLIDGRGSVGIATPMFGRDVLQELAASGHAAVHLYNPPFNQILASLVDASMIPAAAGSHNKILVVDEQKGITGGRNISLAYFARFEEDAAAVTDSDVIVDGREAVDQLTEAVDREFDAPEGVPIAPDVINFVSQRDLMLMVYGAMDAWLRGTIPVTSTFDALSALEIAGLARLAQPPDPAVRESARVYFAQLVRLKSLHGALDRALPAAIDAEVRIIASASRARRVDDANNDGLLKAIGAARHDIVLETPYFILTPRMFDALKRAGRRGVDITVLTNSPLSTDNTASQALLIDTWPELEARIRGLRVFVTARTQMRHAKRAVFDEDLTFIGSYNLDPFSAHLNSEVVVAIWSRDQNARCRAKMSEELVDGSMLEYRIARTDTGHARRYPPGSAQAGRVIVEYGPRNHVPAARIAELERLKAFLISIRNLWDFEVVEW